MIIIKREEEEEELEEEEEEEEEVKEVEEVRQASDNVMALVQKGQVAQAKTALGDVRVASFDKIKDAIRRMHFLLYFLLFLVVLVGLMSKPLE